MERVLLSTLEGHFLKNKYTDMYTDLLKHPLLFKMPTGEARHGTDICICIKFHPENMKSGEKIEKTFKDVEESFLFDLQTDSQQIFSFPLQGLSSRYIEYDDGFLIISLFTIGRLKARRKKLGELVLQVESFYYWTTLNLEIPAALLFQ